MVIIIIFLNPRILMLFKNVESFLKSFTPKDVCRTFEKCLKSTWYYIHNAWSIGQK